MTHDVLTAVRLLSTPGQIIEVRAITEDGVASGYFDSPEELAEKLEALDGLPTVQGVYVTLNPVNPALFSRRANRIKMRLGKKDATTADSDIVRRQWLPVDIDPVRPSGVSSTDAEHETAIATARRVAAFLTETGFPAPLLADSGNGAHLLYSIDLPNDDTSRLLVKRCLEVLDILFSDENATIDTANFNAARIWKLYGTMSRKGDNTSERPHRRSAIIETPAVPAIVRKEILERLTGALPDSPPADDAGNQSRGQKIVLPQWLSNYGISVRYEKPYDGGTLYILDECPFSCDHKDGAYAIQFPNGAIYAGCHHTSCGSGKQRWQELRERYEPVTDRHRKETHLKENTETAPPRLPPLPAPLPAVEEQSYRDEALDLLQHGDPKQFMLRTFALDHEGDESVAECMILSLASRSIINTKGLHVSVTGESGKGKSHAFDMMLKQLPEQLQLSGSMSNKALFYIDNLQPGMAIVLDDTCLTEDMATILKGVTTSFQKPFVHRTVTKDRKGVVCTIPERCVWWVAKVEGCGDDQVFNRMLTCWIDDTLDQDDRVLVRTLKSCETIPEHGTDERREILVCRAMWEFLGQKRYFVLIPYATRIQFQSHKNRRNPEMLLDLIKAHTILRSLQREHRKEYALDYIVATREDFDAAITLYARLNSSAGGQNTKLTKKESDLLDAIINMHQDEFTIPQLQKKTGLANNTLYKLIHGYTTRGITHTGLLEKCPAIAYTDRTVVIDNEFSTGSTRRRTNAYTFDPDIYAQWSGGVGVWLKDEHDPKDAPDENNYAAFLHDCCNFDACAAHNEKSNASPDSLFTGNNTHLDLSNSVYCCKIENTQQPQDTSHDTSVCVCETEHAAINDPKIAKNPQNNEPEVESPRISMLHMKNTCDSVQHTINPHAGELMVAGVKIHAVDYKRLDIPEPHTPCHCCGRKSSWYVEKLTAARKVRPKNEQGARRLCRKCYDAAVRRDCAAVPPLPGMIDLVGMERHSPNIGKCSVCDLGSATYLNEETGVKLCEQCHTREVQRQCSSSEVRA